MIGYKGNHTRDTYKLYNTDTKRFITERYFKWAEWEINDPERTLKMFRDRQKEDLVTGIEEDKIPTSDIEDKIPVLVIPDEG